MSGTTDDVRVARRRQRTIEEIVDAAWQLSHEQGLGGFSMRLLGDRVGMRAQSLYSYFASKHELFDAMFAQASRAFVDAMTTTTRADDPATAAGENDLLGDMQRVAREFVRFCVCDPMRFQLLFQRTIPGFEPSAQSYALAQQAYDVSVASLRSAGFTDDDLDLVTAVMSGLASQQIANDPGGDRWERLTDRAASMLLNELTRTDSN
jgi:AcrR family transcriptional regulator